MYPAWWIIGPIGAGFWVKMRVCAAVFVPFLLGAVAACASTAKDVAQVDAPLPRTDPKSECPDLAGIYLFTGVAQPSLEGIKNYIGGSAPGRCMTRDRRSGMVSTSPFTVGQASNIRAEEEQDAYDKVLAKDESSASFTLARATSAPLRATLEVTGHAPYELDGENRPSVQLVLTLYKPGNVMFERDHYTVLTPTRGEDYYELAVTRAEYDSENAFRRSSMKLLHNRAHVPSDFQTSPNPPPP